jgi:carbamoyltransferase
MRILGVSAFYHDSAAALVVNGQVVAAAQEERFTRQRHDASFPWNALAFCLAEGRLSLEAIDFVAFYDKPFLKFERLLETSLAFAPAGFSLFRRAMATWLGDKLFMKRKLILDLTRLAPGVDWKQRLLFSEHHLSHAASAYYPSPFNAAAVLTLDGVGEWATSSVAFGVGPKLEIQREIHYPHSLGLLYSAFTQYAGFRVNSGEYKLMGLAPYGRPRYAALIRDHLVDIKNDGSFRLDLRYFGYCAGLSMTNHRFEELFGQPSRTPDQPLTSFHMDVAASIQLVLEEAILRMGKALARDTGQRNLCLAGGVALNCVANGKLLKSHDFENIWIQPAAGDAGGSIGAALSAHYIHCGSDRAPAQSEDGMRGAFLGPAYSQDAIEHELSKLGANFRVEAEPELLESAVNALVAGKAVGWFQGRMEFGPRALGARSILADARRPQMQKTLNLKVKNRESFRPFAPAVLREDVAEWFELDCDSPYMCLVANVREERRRAVLAADPSASAFAGLDLPRSEIPAVTHVDYSARVQTVHQDTNPRFHALLQSFKQRTGCPVLVNTSFNVRGEPIVCSPADAYRCFMGTAIDMLVIGDCVLKREHQDPALERAYAHLIAPD